MALQSPTTTTRTAPAVVFAPTTTTTPPPSNVKVKISEYKKINKNSKATIHSTCPPPLAPLLAHHLHSLTDWLTRWLAVEWMVVGMEVSARWCAAQPDWVSPPRLAYFPSTITVATQNPTEATTSPSPTTTRRQLQCEICMNVCMYSYECEWVVNKAHRLVSLWYIGG